MSALRGVLKAFRTVLGRDRSSSRRRNPWPKCPGCFHRTDPATICPGCGWCPSCVLRCDECSRCVQLCRGRCLDDEAARP